MQPQLQRRLLYNKLVLSSTTVFTGNKNTLLKVTMKCVSLNYNMFMWICVTLFGTKHFSYCSFTLLIPACFGIFLGTKNKPLHFQIYRHFERKLLVYFTNVLLFVLKCFEASLSYFQQPKSIKQSNKTSVCTQEKVCSVLGLHVLAKVKFDASTHDDFEDKVFF